MNLREYNFKNEQITISTNIDKLDKFSVLLKVTQSSLLFFML